MDVCGLNPLWVCVAWAEGACELEGGFTLVEGLRDFFFWAGWWGNAVPALPFNCTSKFAVQLRKTTEISSCRINGENYGIRQSV